MLNHFSCLIMKKMFRAINAVVFSVLLVTANVYALPARLDVLFVLDNSGTMKSNDPEFMTRRSVLKLTKAFSQDSRVGVGICQQGCRRFIKKIIQLYPGLRLLPGSHSIA